MSKKALVQMAQQAGLGLATMAIAVGLPTVAGAAAAVAGFDGLVVGFGALLALVPAVPLAAYIFHPHR